jgi:radical SAM protein (TIGR01212 family)
MEKGWRGLPYYPISEHYRKILGTKIFKIPVAVVDDCPNRMGLKGMQTCVFCDVWGSAARSEAFDMDLRSQIASFQKKIGDRVHAQQFLIYFQAYTNTFAKISELQSNFEVALSFPWVRGFVVGTRPDCVSPAVLRLWCEYQERTFVSVELGVQSFVDSELAFMRRGHTSSQSLDAIERIHHAGIRDLGVHLIFGNPGETEASVIRTARILNDLPVQHVKLHNLHVLKNTPLEDMYLGGQFVPLDLDIYANHVRAFLQHLRPDIAVQRLAAYAPRWEELIAPAWTSDKMGVHQVLIDFLRAGRNYQAEHFIPEDSFQQERREELRQRSFSEEIHREDCERRFQYQLQLLLKKTRPSQGMARG